MSMDKSKKKEMRMNYLQEREDRKIEDGVYRIKNLVNDKVYVGSMRDVHNLNGIIFQLRTGSFMNAELQKDWNSLGEDHFEIEVLESFEQEDNPSRNTKRRIDLEREWKKKLDVYGEKGYHKK